MAEIAVVGDGPGGLSAALFLAKNGHEVTVYGLDETAMHYAYLYNYLGIPEIDGSEFQAVARRQVEGFGARLVADRVVAIEPGERILLRTEGGDESTVDYVVLSEGKKTPLADALGLARDDRGGVLVDRDQRSSVDRVYVVGRAVRPTRSQAIISAGAGAIAALDILAREAGRDVQDWDTPPKD